LESKTYPFQKLFALLQAADYTGWMLLEAGKPPQDRVAALKEQRRLFDELLAKTSSKA
jgi:hypothetical protein